MLSKQAKTLSKRQITLTTALLQQTRYPTRNLTIFLLSVKAGLRAKEIASLTWDMLTDPEGTSRSCAASQGRSQQGIVWQGHPVEQGPQNSLASTAGATWEFPLRHHHRTSRANLCSGNREPVRSLVQSCWSAGLFQPFRQTHLHHQCRTNDLHRGRVSAGRADAGWTQSPQHHPALHRG